MRLHIPDLAQAEQLREAFLTRQPFTLTGAGVKVQYVASQMSTDYDPLPAVSLELQQVAFPVAATDWDGEGLPPVGIDCETLWSSTTGEYVAVRVVGHDEDRAVVRFISSDRKGEYDSDRQHNDYGFPIFRPMRSAEDRAAEQALREIEQLYTEGGPAAVYDAGYRKVQP